MSTDETTRSTILRPKLNRRHLLKTGSAAAVAGAATIGAKRSPAFAAPAVLQGEQITLRYGTWFWYEPGRAEAWRYMIEQFHAAQNEIRIEESGAPFDEFTNNIIVQLQAGGLDDDLVQTTPDLVLRLLRAGQLASLQDVIDSLGITTLSPAHDYITVDGQVHGLDVVTVVFGLLYNAQLFEDEGITTLPASVEEWVEVSQALTSRPDQFGMYSAHLTSEPESFWFQLQEWAMPFDGVWANEAGPQVNSEPIINAVSLFKTFYDTTFPQGSDDSTATRQWGDGQIAQQLIVSAAVNVYRTSAPELYPHIRSYSLPWESKRSIARIHPITVNANGANVDAAKEFVKFLYTPENYRELLTRQLDVIPAYDVGGLDEYFSDLPWLTGYEDISPTTPPDIMGDFIFNNQEFGQIVINRVTEVLTADRPVEEAMAQAQQELEELGGRLGL
ncbi:MAG: extracellular solute-binding protein [Chloroflexia bacterium]|nr:extracellular solute-binding protein [Chloroflexia bacterium]